MGPVVGPRPWFAVSYIGNAARLSEAAGPEVFCKP